VEGLALRFLVEIPSCVPAAPNLETAAHNIDSKTIEELIVNDPRFFGLGEVMNYPGVLFRNEEVLTKVLLGRKLNIIDGHSPGVSGRDLDAYIAAGIESDHESTTAKEFIEKLRKGMKVMAREGSLTKDLRNVLKEVKTSDLDLRNCLLCSDDRNVIDLYKNGHMNAHVRLAVKEGIDPIVALQMVTINPATYFGIQKDLGSIAPGKIADIAILEDLEQFKVNSTIFGGRLIYHNNTLLENYSPPTYPSWAVDTVRLPENINSEAFRAKTKLPDGTYPVRVIGVIPNSVITKSLEEQLSVKNGWIQPLPEEDIFSITVIERYGVNGNISNGFIKGFKINKTPFAMATTVAHDSHNIIVTGSDHQTMMKVVEKLSHIKGGYVVSIKDQYHELPLPYGGLMTTESFQILYNQLNDLKEAFNGFTDFEEPMMALSFMALPVIPHLKITDRGLVDVDKFIFTDLIIQ
jgi:adenine deaminase